MVSWILVILYYKQITKHTYSAAQYQIWKKITSKFYFHFYLKSYFISIWNLISFLFLFDFFFFFSNLISFWFWKHYQLMNLFNFLLIYKFFQWQSRIVLKYQGIFAKKNKEIKKTSTDLWNLSWFICI